MIADRRQQGRYHIPIVLGSGKRFAERGTDKRVLRQVRTDTPSSGIVVL